MPSPTDRLRAGADRALRDAAPARRMRTKLASDRLAAWGGEGAVRLLDAGCDVGLLSLALARRLPRWKIEAVDVNDDMLQLGRTWAAEEGLSQIEFRHADVTRDLPAGTYDAVVALECLTVIPDLDGALSGLAGALRPGGLFVAHVPDHDWEPVLRGSADEWPTAVRHGFKAEEFAELLDGHGLRVTWTHGTMRTPLHAAQEVRDRIKHASTRIRLAAHPGLTAAAWLEGHGIAFGPARGLYVEAVRR
jgi:2-polyprenyl-3-methyl-5-hydroxy-6-metoxy-1,4-benzoquinol methylase